MGDAEERDIDGRTSSILNTTKRDAQVKKKKVDEGKSKTKAIKRNEEQQPEEGERKTEIKSCIT